MDILIGTALLLAVLAFFTFFNYKAPYGSKAMGALASAACASFLVEAFHGSFLGQVLGLGFLEEVGMINGELSGVAAAILVAMACWISNLTTVDCAEAVSIASWVVTSVNLKSASPVSKASAGTSHSISFR